MRLRLPPGVVTLAITEPVSWGVLYYATGALLGPMQRELGCGFDVLGAGLSLGLLVAALGAPRVGRLVDREGPRRIMMAGSLLGTVALALWSQADGVGLVLVALVLAGAAQAMVLYEPAFTAVAQWSPGARERARALALITTTGGLASAIFVPLTVGLAAAWGWRAALLVLAAGFVAITLPAHARLPGRVGPGAAHRAAAAAVPALGGLGGAAALQALASSGLSLYFVVVATRLGHGRAAITAAALVVGLAQLPARWLAATVPATSAARALACALLLQGVALLALPLAHPTAVLLVVTLLFGTGNGATTLLRAMLIAHRVGPVGHGAASGAIARAGLMGRAAAPWLVGLVWDASGGGVLVLAPLGIACFAAAALVRLPS